MEPEQESPAPQSPGRLRRLTAGVRRGWDWLRDPESVGRPVEVSPRGLRLLVLLVVGNLFVLGLLTAALYRASTGLLATRSPLSPPPVVIPCPDRPPSPEPSPTPVGGTGALAFTLRRNGNADIYALNPSNEQLVRLTYDPAEDRDPAWSPDGNYIAFASNRAHNWDIYLLDLLSGAVIRLTHDPAFDANPTWSPDGQWIAFESYRRGSLDIYVMSTTGQRLRRVTLSDAPDYAPAWSPDSRALAYTSFRDGTKDIFVHPLASGSEVNITQSPDLDEDSAAWSADGMRLAYVSGPRGNPSIQVTAFDWDTLSTDRAQTELFGSGYAPAWSPKGENLVYVYRRGGYSHLVVTSVTEWAMFREVYSVDGFIDDLAWTARPLSTRVVARAQIGVPPEEPPLYVELVQPTPTAGPPYRMVTLPGVSDASNDDGPAYLSDRVNESFNALRRRVEEETGWDYLAHLGTTQLPMAHTPYAGHSRMSWHVCGRAFGLDQTPYDESPRRVELAREDVGNVTYWRVFLRATAQDGSMGEPLREPVWDLHARDEGGRAMVEGGRLVDEVPEGYYVDFTTLAADYGWERVPALWRWRYFWPDIRWWRFRKTDGLNWWECMLEVFTPEEIEPVFGPVPGYER